ncbi:MAG TPA: ISAzo13 family transposase [Nitrospiraceae bacterium]|jgi:hypothetical protein|nr:ISAzo13 family transposase [Nitrospiraceae bacterium]
MKYEMAGDPMTGMKWTRRATRKIAKELQREEIMISDKSVSRILKELGYSLQANRKKIALSGNGSLQQRAERDLQFRHICRMREGFARRQEPVISIDTKKNELIGNFKNSGRIWRDRRCDVADHDFPSYAEGKMIPYGIYDTVANEGAVYIGLSHDTAAFAVDCICTWWKHYGSVRYPHARRMLILADSGGTSNAAWHYHLWYAFCQEYGLKVTVCHYPAGASKWNPIEHRLFSEILKNWAGIPLVDIETALKFVRTTKTKTGLKVTAALNREHYPLKEKISPADKAQVLIKRHQPQPKLNYTLHPFYFSASP